MQKKFNTGALLVLFLSLFVAESKIYGQSQSGQYLQTELPEQWRYVTDFSQLPPDEDQWWNTFEDATLDSLIEMTVANNYNLAIACKRIEIANNNIKIARSSYYPEVSANVGWYKERTSGVSNKVKGPTTTESQLQLGLSASWEIDVFGRIAKKTEQSKHLLDASRAERDAMWVSLSAKVASTYINLRVLQAQLDVARQHIIAQRKVVDLTEARLEAGIASMLDVTQAKIVLYSTQATVPVLENSITSTINSLAILTGTYYQDIAPLVATAQPLPDYHKLVATGLPTELLRRRPDIVEAEANLAAAASALGIAKKDFLPTLSITGTFGTESRSIDDLFSSQAVVYTIAPTLSWTIFSGFSRSYKVANARRNFEIEIDNYNLTVMNAVAETDNAMSDYLTSLRHIDILKNVVDQSQQSLTLSVDLYKQGLTNFSNVSDAQVNLLEYQNSLVVAKGDALTSLISLYEALGGGWDNAPSSN